MKRIKDTLCLLAVLSGLLTWRGVVTAQSPLRASDEVVRWEVQGFGPTALLAERDALERACEQVKDHLATLHPHLLWTPDASYLRNSGMVRLQGSPVEKILERTGKVQQVTLLVTLHPNHLEEMDAYNRLQRIQDRHRWLGLVLAGIAAGLVILKMYLWLEEATRGYTTAWLRAAAMIVLGVVLAVLLWLA